jgi:hypothetical protein
VFVEDEMTVSRRAALGRAATIFAAAPMAGLIGSEAAAPAGEDFGALPSKHQLWEDLLFMIACGSRNTGFPGHLKFVDFLADRLKECPGVDVHRDSYSLARWVASNYTLSAQGPNAPMRSLHATSAYPNSGKTGAAGVTGALVDLGRTTPNEVGGSNPIAITKDIRGKIVLIQAPVHGFPFGANFKIWGAYESNVTLPDRIKEAIWANRATPVLDPFKEAGAAGVILAWEGVSDENAEGQYAPFGKKFADVPALWVGEKTGEELRRLAAAGGQATITLEATITPGAPTDTVYGVLPGASDEIILVHTHSDGPNAVEENAPIGVVALAKYLASLPKGTLKRTYLFTMTTGHMAFSPTARSWRAFVDTHPDLVKRCVGALTLEHLGARMWIDRDGTYVPSGENQTTMVITQSKTLADLALRSCTGTIDDRVIAVNPYQHRYTGESGGVIEAGIPTIGIMPVPSYLLKDTPGASIEKIDPRLFRVQLENSTRMLRKMDGMSREQLAGTRPLDD